MRPIINVVCEVGGCGRKATALKKCDRHYREQREATQPRCLVDNCNKPVRSAGMCIMHYTRKRRWGDVNVVKYQPPGSKIKTRGGYIKLRVSGHPNADKNSHVTEHVLVMSNKLGRGLYKHEHVHHKNGVTWDNRIENLELWSVHHPCGQKVEDLLLWANEIIQMYGGMA